MKPLQLTLAILLASMIEASAEERGWKSLLSQPVDDEWWQIIGITISPKEPKKRETLAAKITAIQDLIREDHGQFLPVFVPPSFGVHKLDPIPATTETRTGLPISEVPAMEVFRYIAQLNNHEIVETEVGIVFCPRQSADKRVEVNPE